MQKVASTSVLELVRGVSTGLALWGGSTPCPACSPVQRCPEATCVCGTPSPLSVACAALLLACVIISAYLVGAVWGLPTRGPLGPPLPAPPTVTVEAVPLSIEEQARAQVSFVRSRAASARIQ